jgi:hypothetical protein
MQLITPRRTGRPPKRAEPDVSTLLTIRVTGETKNLLIDQADAFGLTLAEYLTVLVHRDVANHA